MKSNYDEGMVDLGRPYGEMSPVAEPSPKKEKKVDYPTLYINHGKDGEKLDDLPDGEFYFVAKGKLKSYREDMENGTCSCEISVMGIKPLSSGGKKAKKSKEADESLDEELEKIASKKNK